MVAEEPETFVQEKDLIFPSSSEELLPFRFTEFVGSVMLRSEPALATGALFAAAFTVTLTSSLCELPLSSVTVRRIVYDPATSPETVVLEAEED